jgi:methylmalonyl-CoA/ethylmalonyl-CoA epimerase
MQVHHVGYVVRDIDGFAASLPGLVLENEVEDPLQNARLSVYRVGGASRIELIQPHGPGAFTWAYLEKNGDGPHHICYAGIAANALDDVLAKHRMMKIRGPMPAVLFGREVVFAVTRQRAIVEFML